LIQFRKITNYIRAFNVNEFVNGKPQQGFPYTLAPRAADMHAFAKTCRSICSRVLEVIALGLGIDPAQGGQDWFSPRHDLTHGRSGSVLRFLYYPKIEPEHQYDAASDLRCGAHSDYGTVTLLFQLQGQPGLEILRDAQTWSAVPVNPTAEPDVPILVNIGDLLSYWTNGYLKSAVHRVIAADSSAPERYSIAYFCHPLDDAKLDPVPSAVVQRHQPEARNGGVVITAREHLEARLRATYT
jgi:isopenicillin N synthase-like dioxygenase